MTLSKQQKEENQLLSLLKDAIEFALYRLEVDPNSPYGGRVVMVSPSMKDIIGTDDPWRFETWFETIHPDDLPRVMAANQRAWQEHVRYNESARVFNRKKGDWCWVHTLSTPVLDDRGNITHFTGLVLDITEHKQAEIELARRSALEDLILSLSTRFINLPPYEVDQEIDAALQAIGEFTEVDRAYLFSFSDDKKAITCSHEWCREGIEPQIHRLTDIPALALPWSNEILLRGEILHIPSVNNLGPEAREDKKEFQLQQIQSLVAVPMFYQNEVVGFLGFDAVREEKCWPEEIQKLLQVVSSIFINAMENQRAQAALKQAHDELELRVIERTKELEQANRALRQEIEQRRRAEEYSRISEALYLEFFDNSPLQIFVQEVLPDGHFRVLRTNPAHQAGSGMPPEKIWGKTIEELVVPEVAQAINQHYRDCIAAGKPIEYEESGPTPYWDLSRIRTYRTTLAPIRDSQGNIVRLVGASQDITEQKKAEEIVMDRARDEAVSAERSRLARELHDAVTQTLFSTTLTAEVLPKIWERNPEEGRQKLEELRELTRGALAEMRTLLMELRPDALEDADLRDLLRHLSNAFIARARIPIRVELDHPCSLPMPVKVAFYRVAQESLNNIAKHSEAEQVTLELTSNLDETILSITDDGIGFEPDLTLKADHYGLRIMQERAEQAGAEMNITSRPGQGTSISMRWLASQNSHVIVEKGKKNE